MTMKKVELKVELGKSFYGHFPQPEIWVRTPEELSHRVAKAVVHQLAAEVELASEDLEDTPQRTVNKWCVETELITDNAGRVHLELINGDEAEVKASMKTLKAAVATWRKRQ